MLRFKQITFKRILIIALVTSAFYFFRCGIDNYRRRAIVFSQSSERVFSRIKNTYSGQEFKALPQGIVCQNYFNTLYNLNEEWSINGFNNDEPSYLSKKHCIDSIRHLRVYGKCYITESNSYNDIQLVESRLLPLFTRDMPVYLRWNGSSFIDEIYHSESNVNEESKLNFQKSFWGEIKKNMKGRGIVISIGEGGVSETKRLIKVLKYLNNTLPIQLVHKGDLSINAMKELIDVASKNIEDGGTEILNGFQDILFVNAERAINSEYIHLFQRFSNKWIASLFTSFEEMILMDSDSVPFVNPSEFFDNIHYGNTGALFFRDRANGETLKSSEASFYSKFFPSEDEINVLGVSGVSTITKENTFFKFNSKHVMESGMVVIKRSTHLVGLLISTVMQFWKETSRPVYGEKELFWLGQSLSGNENYQFNENTAAAIGILKYDKNKAPSVCSTQPAHFDHNSRLLWLNGGLRKCKIPSWDLDFNKHRRIRNLYNSKELLKANYQSPIEVNGAVIPPNMIPNKFERFLNLGHGFKKIPSMGCNGYVWCASSSPEVGIDGHRGKVITFLTDEIAHINHIINIWTSD